MNELGKIGELLNAFEKREKDLAEKKEKLEADKAQLAIDQREKDIAEMAAALEHDKLWADAVREMILKVEESKKEHAETIQKHFYELVELVGKNEHTEYFAIQCDLETTRPPEPAEEPDGTAQNEEIPISAAVGHI